MAPRSMTRVTIRRRPPSASRPVRPRPHRPPAERSPAEVLRAAAELALDAEQPVVLRDSFAPRRRAGLDLAGTHRDDEVGDRRVLRLARAVGHDRGPPGPAGELDRLDRLGQRPDLVELDQHGVGRVLVDRSLDPRRVRHEQVVADELDPIAEPARQLRPAGPVVLGQAVLDRDDREAGDPVRPEVDQLAGVERPAFLGKAVARGAPSPPLPSSTSSVVAGSRAIARSSPGR